MTKIILDMKKIFVCLVTLLSYMSFAGAQDIEAVSDSVIYIDSSVDENTYIEIAEVGEIESSEFSSSRIIGHWALQEVQIPQDQEFEEDASFRFFDQLEFLYGVVNIIGYDTESWNFSINENRILTLSRGNRYQNFEVLILNSRELVLAADLTLYGRMIYKFVPYERRKLPIVKSKHQEKRNDDTNPIVTRIPIGEILESETPRAVAYNFVDCIYYSNSEKMLSFMTSEAKERFESFRIADGNSNYDPYFSIPGDKLNIKGWEPAINSGKYAEAVLYVQDEGYDELGRVCKKVYVGCVPLSELGHVGFQDITRYGNTNVKVLVVNNNGKWQVIGFK